MARMARVVVPGLWHHITQRGNRRETVFFDDRDRAMYLQLLAQHCRRCSLRVVGYCLMGNHVHLIAIPPAETALAKSLGRAHVDYARWLNLRHGQTGHVWQNRFFSCPMDEGHQWEALRYVECNPVRAGLVSDAPDWPWSSAAAHTGGTDRSGLLDVAEWWQRWTPGAWREALESGIADAALWDRIRDATRSGRPAAGEEFVKRLEAERGRRLRPQKPGPASQSEVDERQMSLIAR
jgi:putative transposase